MTFLDLILNTKDKQIVTTGIIAEVYKIKQREMKQEKIFAIHMFLLFIMLMGF